MSADSPAAAGPLVGTAWLAERLAAAGVLDAPRSRRRTGAGG